mmetsp:Transcript_32630/g.58603  ORF Transcript_32630/g.58603 Transcript_32630/m.58603 type:complete len:203 (+) Transcript_32630:211-819(+)
MGAGVLGDCAAVGDIAKVGEPGHIILMPVGLLRSGRLCTLTLEGLGIAIGTCMEPPEGDARAVMATELAVAYILLVVGVIMVKLAPPEGDAASGPESGLDITVTRIGEASTRAPVVKVDVDPPGEAIGLKFAGEVSSSVSGAGAGLRLLGELDDPWSSSSSPPSGVGDNSACRACMRTAGGVLLTVGTNGWAPTLNSKLLRS